MKEVDSKWWVVTTLSGFIFHGRKRLSHVFTRRATELTPQMLPLRPRSCEDSGNAWFDAKRLEKVRLSREKAPNLTLLRHTGLPVNLKVSVLLVFRVCHRQANIGANRFEALHRTLLRTRTGPQRSHLRFGKLKKTRQTDEPECNRYERMSTFLVNDCGINSWRRL